MTATLPSDSWFFSQQQGSAAELHEWQPPFSARPEVRELVVDRPALVLGSSQRESDVDHGAAQRRGIDVVRRRSGGGAVLLMPGEHLWLDVWLPSSHRLWSDDVVTSSNWLGAAWVACLGGGLTAHEGPLLASEFSSVICFAGVGPGEVLRAGHKLVGLSQRRTREWARFQCVVHHRFQPELMLELMAPGVAGAPSHTLLKVAVVAPGGVIEGLLAHLRAS